MADAIAHMYPSKRTDLEVLNIPFPSAAGFNAYDIDLEAGRDWVLLSIPRPAWIDFCSSLWVDITFIRDKCVENSIEAPMTDAGFFKWRLRSLDTNEEQQELSESVN